LFHQFKEVSATETPGDLEPTVVDILSERLSLLLSATVGAYTLKAATGGRTVYEAEWRHNWDEVLYRLYVTAGEVFSPRVL